ncbi:MAG: glycosyltransferase family 2 protein [Promethearchaeota archaeon]
MKILPVSLVIPTHNRIQKLARLLHSLIKLKTKTQEIIIVNDGSKEQIRALLESRAFKKIILY